MIAISDSFIEIVDKDTYLKQQFGFEWLRENCRCISCFNAVTNQRNIRIIDINPNICPVSHSLTDNILEVVWDDGHHSEYDVSWLITQSQAEKRPQVKLWSGDTTNEVEFVTSSEIKTTDGITRLIKSLMEYGVGFVTNVEPDIKSTEGVIRNVGPPLQTLYGGMWEFSDNMDYLDTAYSNLALDAHTDTSYFIEPAGLIIFHCTKRNCTGGNTLLVDGFRAAKELELETPVLYKCLKNVHTEFQYTDKSHQLTCMTTMIQHDTENKIKQIRFNLYDRSARLPAVQSSQECSLFYKALRRLAVTISRPRQQWWLTLEPGTVAFINNWRVLHGRSTFKGSRTISGAYISMGNLLSRARCLGLIR